MTKRHSVGQLNTLPDGEGHMVEVDGRQIALFRRGERVDAVGDACPHMGAPLSDGYMDDDSVVCPWHGWVFDLKTGQSPFDEEARIPVYRVTVENGEVFVEIGEGCETGVCGDRDAAPGC